MTTPLGYLAVEKKIGDNVPVGAANTTPQPPPQITATNVAKITPQPPSQITATKVAKVTPEPPPQISASMLAMPPSSSLTVEQMRTAGALAGARQKAKLAANKRL